MATLTSPDTLAVFHPLISAWFRERVGSPTDIQARAWPVIATGAHALISAPTGSGKTLTAFLWALDRLYTGAWEPGATRVLYVSPLKALNNDIERNLLRPLSELNAAFAAAEVEAPAIRVQTRSGDTSPADRRRMIRRPPEILITTPESLNILLTSRGGRSVLGALETVILDEVHAVVESRRGTHLVTAVERLARLSGEFQRLALSATIRPLDRIATFVGGHALERSGVDAIYRPRPVERIESDADKQYDVQVCFPADGEAYGPSSELGAESAAQRPPEVESIWDLLARDFRQRIDANRSTLLFANSRRLTERVTRMLNEQPGGGPVYSHHGSLSRELRNVVEERFKGGQLAALVATNSLELGIDIGDLDEVLLIQTPRSIASALQRVGRSGHRVGEVSRGRLYPTFARDFIDAAVVARGIRERSIERARPLTGCLDVLAQVILSMTVAEPWDADELFDFVRTADPYRHLSRREYDLVIEMLAGRYADSRVRELAPRLSFDRLDNTLRARRGVERLLYTSGGTIPDRGYFALRVEGSMAKIGELDEEFVWERSIGDTFTLGAQSWRIAQITHNDVLVRPSSTGASLAPFWRADATDRSFELSERVGEFLESCERRLDAREPEAQTLAWLENEYSLVPAAAEELLRVLRAQRAATGSSLPHRHHLVAEICTSQREQGEERRLILHTTWGGKVNRPLAIAISAAWEKRYGHPAETFHDDDSIVLSVPRGFTVDDLFELVGSGRITALLRERLERTGFFGARFRMSASCALLLPRSDFRRRQPLWLIRQRSKSLFESCTRYPDFPILLETWRSCLEDEFDLESLDRVLEEVAVGEIVVSTVQTAQPSPFAAGVVWRETNRLMYEDDSPDGAGRSGLSDQLLRELVFSSHLRPRLADALIGTLQGKLHRTRPGYAPRDSVELLEWVKERIAIPEREWLLLVAAVEAEAEVPVDELLEPLAAKLALLRLSGASSPGVVVAVESIARLLSVLGREMEGVGVESVTTGPPPSVESPVGPLPAEGDVELAGLLSEWLRHYGPVAREVAGQAFGLEEGRLARAVEALADDGRVVVDRFREGDDAPIELCDSENLERLLRTARSAARPAFEAVPLTRLPLLLGSVQGLIGGGGQPEDLEGVLERLFGFPAPAHLWESEILPARLDPYYTSWLDSLLQETDLLWLGCGRERVTFTIGEELPLLLDGEPDDADLSDLFPEEATGRFGLEEIARRARLDRKEVERRLWQLAWRGRASNTSAATLRRGIHTRFGAAAESLTAPATPGARSGRPSRGRERWRDRRTLDGDWFLIDRGDSSADDALEVEEANRERVRILIERYGILFRELLARELPPLRWGPLFRTLRLMELSGELLAGHFFRGVPGLQFISPSAFRRLSDDLPEDAIYWMSAVDPASPCGLGLPDAGEDLPPRVPSSHLVFHGSRLVVTSRRRGRFLQIRVPPEAPDLDRYLGFLRVLLTRQFRPVQGIDVETVNDEPIGTSPYARAIAEGFTVTRDHRAMKLRRRYA